MAEASSTGFDSQRLPAFFYFPLPALFIEFSVYVHVVLLHHDYMYMYVEVCSMNDCFAVKYKDQM